MSSAVEKYLSNPIEIQAILRSGTVERDREIVDFIQENNGDFVYREQEDALPQERAVTSYFTIVTVNGEQILPVGWYLIRGVEGELFPCSKEAFLVKYKPLKRA